jgi:hypothetical protein
MKLVNKNIYVFWETYNIFWYKAEWLEDISKENDILSGQCNFVTIINTASHDTLILYNIYPSFE